MRLKCRRETTRSTLCSSNIAMFLYASRLLAEEAASGEQKARVFAAKVPRPRKPWRCPDP